MNLLMEESSLVDREVDNKLKLLVALEEYRVKIERFGMSKDTAIALERLHPGIVNNIGLEKFTELPSGTKQSVALEAINWKQTGLAGAAILAIAALAYKIISWVFDKIFGGSSGGGGGGAAKKSMNAYQKLISEMDADEWITSLVMTENALMDKLKKTKPDAFDKNSVLYAFNSGIETFKSTYIGAAILVASLDTAYAVLKGNEVKWTEEAVRKLIGNAAMIAGDNPKGKQYNAAALRLATMIIKDNTISQTEVYMHSDESKNGIFSAHYYNAFSVLEKKLKDIHNLLYNTIIPNALSATGDDKEVENPDVHKLLSMATDTISNFSKVSKMIEDVSPISNEGGKRKLTVNYGFKLTEAYGKLRDAFQPNNELRITINPLVATKSNIKQPGTDSKNIGFFKEVLLMDTVGDLDAVLTNSIYGGTITANLKNLTEENQKKCDDLIKKNSEKYKTISGIKIKESKDYPTCTYGDVITFVNALLKETDALMGGYALMYEKSKVVVTKNVQMAHSTMDLIKNRYVDL